VSGRTGGWGHVWGGVGWGVLSKVAKPGGFRGWACVGWGESAGKHLEASLVRQQQLVHTVILSELTLPEKIADLGPGETG
jgi:hypothetical protein